MRRFHAGHVTEDIAKPRQHALGHGPRLILSGGWSQLPRNFCANSASGRGLNDANRFLDRGIHISSVYTLDLAEDNPVFCRYGSWLTEVRPLDQGIEASIGFQHMARTPLWNIRNAPHQTSIPIYTRRCLHLSRHRLSSVTFKLSGEGPIFLERPVHSCLGTISKSPRSACTSSVVSLTSWVSSHVG